MRKLRTPAAKVFGALLIYLPFRFAIYFLASKLGLPHTNLIELFSELFIIAAVALLIFSNGRSVWKLSREARKWPLLIKLIVALLLWSLVTISFTPAGIGQAIRGLRLDFLGLVIVLTFWLFPLQTEETESILDLTLWGLILVAAVGLFELAFGPGYSKALGFVPFEFLAGKIRQVHSLLPSPNMFGSAMVLLTALLLRRFKDLKGSPAIWGLMLVIGVLAGSSYSRSAWVAFALLGALVFFANLKRGIIAWSIGFLALGLAVGIVLGVWRYHGSFYTAATHDSSSQQHETALKTAADGWSHFGEYWLTGDGIGTSGPASYNSTQPSRIPESWYIQILQETGLIGLGLYIVIFYLTATELFQAKEPILGYMTIALATNAVFLHIWADDRFVHIVFWTAVGAALFHSKPSTQQAKS